VLESIYLSQPALSFSWLDFRHRWNVVRIAIVIQATVNARWSDRIICAVHFHALAAARGARISGCFAHLVDIAESEHLIFHSLPPKAGKQRQDHPHDRENTTKNQVLMNGQALMLPTHPGAAVAAHIAVARCPADSVI
jgi:hypothetical protein